MMGRKAKKKRERVNFESYQTPRSTKMRTKNSSAAPTKRKNPRASEVGTVRRPKSAHASSCYNSAEGEGKGAAV